MHLSLASRSSSAYSRPSTVSACKKVIDVLFGVPNAKEKNRPLAFCIELPTHSILSFSFSFSRTHTLKQVPHHSRFVATRAVSEALVSGEFLELKRYRSENLVSEFLVAANCRRLDQACQKRRRHATAAATQRKTTTATTPLPLSRSRARLSLSRSSR